MKTAMKKFKKYPTRELEGKLAKDKYSAIDKMAIREVLKTRNGIEKPEIKPETKPEIKEPEVKNELKSFKDVSEKERQDIRELYKTGNYSYRKLEKQFNLKQNNGSMAMKIVKL